MASREYKGPEALPWQKLRILPLKQPRQEELIENTFLTEDQKDLVRQHLATVETGIFGNPLFMSLLCRYIGDNQKVPNNDHELLINHIDRLGRRDPDYIQKKYSLDAEQLLKGATLLAVLFAERPELSLAPKCDDIVTAFAERQYNFPVDVVHLLSALIEVKIGRSDVKEAKLGDRRFTFSHRRYQETLFVQYLAKNPEHIATRELLLDNRWREFTVTLIQAQPANVVERFAQEAARIMDSLEPMKIDVPQELGEGLHYFDWNNGELLHLLTLLNEGFARRLEEVPDNLRLVISRQLSPRWYSGDLYDKLMVVRYGCLLPIAEYQEIFEWAINTGADQFLSASFNNAQYLGALSDSTSKWLRQRFANETLVADNKIELYKLDALGNRLPSNIGAPIIFDRCRSLRSLCYEPCFFRFLIDNRLGLRYIHLLINPKREITFEQENLLKVNVMLILFLYIIMPIVLFFIEKGVIWLAVFVGLMGGHFILAL